MTVILLFGAAWLVAFAYIYLIGEIEAKESKYDEKYLELQRGGEVNDILRESIGD